MEDMVKLYVNYSVPQRLVFGTTDCDIAIPVHLFDKDARDFNNTDDPLLRAIIIKKRIFEMYSGDVNILKRYDYTRVRVKAWSQ